MLAKKMLGLGAVVSMMSLVACVANTGDDPADTTDTSGEEDELKQSVCGGIAGLPCPSGYECVLKSPVIPDQTGTCHKKTCVQNALCAKNAHFDKNACKCVPNFCVQNALCAVNGHWDSILCECVANGPTCKTLTCAQGSHCEQKGINGGSVAVCIKN